MKLTYKLHQKNILTMYTKPRKDSHLCEAQRRAKAIILYKFNIFIMITTVKHAVTVIQIHV